MRERSDIENRKMEVGGEDGEMRQPAPETSMREMKRKLLGAKPPLVRGEALVEGERG